MNQILIDTSGWAVLFVCGESQHQAAVALFERLLEQGHRFVTTNYTVAELISLFYQPTACAALDAVSVRRYD